MKIATNKQMRLDELIRYVWESEEGSTNRYISHKGKTVTVDNSGVEFSSKDNGIVLKDDTFTLEVEEELTEETYLQDVELIGLIQTNEERVRHVISEWSCPVNARTNISGIKDIYDLKSLHKVNRDGSLMLLYTEEHGIPTEGTLEI